MNVYTPTNVFYPSFKMGDVVVREPQLIEILGEGDGEGSADDKSSNCWSGILTINADTVDEEQCKVCCWDWKGGLEAGYGVSVWVEKPRFLQDWKNLLTG